MSSSPLSPGIAFLGRGLVYFAVYLLSTHYIVSHLAASSGYEIPGWAVISGLVIALPVFGRLYVAYRELRNRQRAAALGARPIPRAVGKWIGNLDILRASLRDVEIGYPGDGIVENGIVPQGPAFTVGFLWNDITMTTVPEHIKTILATDFTNYEKGPSFHRAMGSVLGTGVFNSDGEMWKFHRSITRPTFVRDRISDFDLFDRHAEEVVVKLKERLREGHAVDFQDVMLRFTLDTATEFLFGSCVKALSAGLPYPPRPKAPVPSAQRTAARGDTANAFSAAFLEAQLVIANRERASWVWPLLEIWGDKTKEPMKVVNAYIEPIIKEAIARRQKAVSQGEHQGDDDEGAGSEQTLLDSLMDATMDPTVLRDEILNILIGMCLLDMEREEDGTKYERSDAEAGRDTTAATLTFAVYLLSQHPEVTRRLRAEILDKVGHRRPDFDDLKELKDLRAVLNETLRLFPVVPFNIRESIKETIWPSPDPAQKPLYVPAHTKIAYSVFIMHRRQDLWGPDAEEFDPDRFLDDRLQRYLLKNPSIFLPFNAGPRICLGQQYAYNQMSFMIIRLMQNFTDITLDLDSAPPESTPPAAWAQSEGRKAREKVWPKMHLTMYANGGVWVKMKEAQESDST